MRHVSFYFIHFLFFSVSMVYLPYQLIIPPETKTQNYLVTRFYMHDGFITTHNNGTRYKFPKRLCAIGTRMLEKLLWRTEFGNPTHSQDRTIFFT